MILNIRGTHGSGKSYIVHQILKRFPNTEMPGKGEKTTGYIVQLKPRSVVFVVGPYKTACGGCDAVQPYDLIWPRVETAAELGHVLFEGALVSSSVGNIGRAMAERNDCTVAFLDTPLEVCLERIRKRREAKGDLRPLNPHNTTVKFEGILRSRPKMEALGLRCVDLNYKKATEQVLALLGVK
jgi:hypothetical protein